MGHSVLVLEEHEAIGEPVDCSGVVGREAFTSLGLPATSIVDELRRVELIAPSGATIEYHPAQPLAYLVDRTAFDRSLATLARDAGATIRTSSRVVDLQTERSGVTLDVRGDGQQLHVSAKAAVIAGGPRYRFQESLGMGRPSRYLRTVQTELPMSYDGETKVFFGRAIAPGSFGWFLPICRQGAQHVKVGVTATAESQTAFLQFVAHLQQHGLLNGHRVASKSWMIPIRPLARTFAERVLAVGDAAGQAKPTTGGGLYYGLLCAQIAAETLSHGLHAGALSAASLAAYELRWNDVLGKELRTALWFRRVVQRLSDRDLNVLFDVILHENLLAWVDHRVNFDWHHQAILGIASRPRFALALMQGLLRSWLPA